MAEFDNSVDEETRELKERLTAAWRQLGEASLTHLERKEVRNQMRQNCEKLKRNLQMLSEFPSSSGHLERERERLSSSQC